MSLIYLTVEDAERELKEIIKDELITVDEYETGKDGKLVAVHLTFQNSVELAKFEEIRLFFDETHIGSFTGEMIDDETFYIFHGGKYDDDYDPLEHLKPDEEMVV